MQAKRPLTIEDLDARTQSNIEQTGTFDGYSQPDELAQAIDSPKKPQAPRVVTESNDGLFLEACPKCHGRGAFYGYSGRYVGPCFTCKGKGKKAFKTSRANREAASERAATRKANVEQENWNAFRESNTIVATWILESRESFPFAQSMYDAIRKYGELTERQLAACESAVLKRQAARDARQARVEAAPVIDMAKLQAAFETARANGLKRLKLRLAGFTVSPASETSANAGALYVKSGDEYLGKVKEGKFFKAAICTAEQESEFLALANDPIAAAIAHGKRTGTCSCCGAELTNAESIALGIGPICRSNWGL